MDIRNVSFDTTGVYGNKLRLSIDDQYICYGNVKIPTYVKKYIINKIKLEKKQRIRIYRSKSVEEINELLYTFATDYTLVYNKNEFKLIYKTKDEKRKEKKFDLSLYNLKRVEGIQFFKLCTLSRKEIKLIESLDFPLSHTVKIIKKEFGKNRIVYNIEGQKKTRDNYSKIAKKLNIYLNQYQVHLFKELNSFAYQTGRSYSQFLKVHCNSNSLLKLDIKDFFESVTREHLQLQLKKFILSNDVLNLYLNMATIKVGNSCFLGQGLPNAAPLSNLYLWEFDTIVSEYCIQNNLKYSRYCDDILISSCENIIGNDIEKWVGECLNNYSLELNENKTKYFHNKDIVIGNIRIENDLILSSSFFTKIYNTIINIIYDNGENSIDMLRAYSDKYIKPSKRSGGTKKELITKVMMHIKGRIQYAIHVNKYNYNLSKCIKAFNMAVRLNITDLKPIYNHPIYENVVLIPANDGSWIPKICEYDANTVVVKMNDEELSNLSYVYYLYQGKYVRLYLQSESECNYTFFSYDRIHVTGVRSYEEYNKLEKQVKYFYREKN